jgi:hypothetical protein
VFIGARWIEASPSSVVLRSSKAYAVAIERHPADVALAHDVLDRQVVDAEGFQIVRPADVYLATVDGRVELVGIEVGVRALLRRLGPKRLRSRFRPGSVIDWATIRSFSPARADGVRPPGRRSDLAGQAGTGLALDGATGEVRRLRPSDIEAALKASGTKLGRVKMSAVDTPAPRRIARLRRWLKRVLGLAAVLGPGLIAANAGNDAGGILTYASAGSQFGYRTLFLMVLITVALVVVQEMCSARGVHRRGTRSPPARRARRAWGRGGSWRRLLRHSGDRRSGPRGDCG